VRAQADRLERLPVTFTAADEAELERAFPDGVCDCRRRGPQQQRPIGTWLNYTHRTTPFRDDEFR
jgi:Tannase-like family of unknown function (DUF6351)